MNISSFREYRDPVDDDGQRRCGRALCGLLMRNRCPSLVTAYTWLKLTTPAGKSVFGNPAGKQRSCRSARP